MRPWWEVGVALGLSLLREQRDAAAGQEISQLLLCNPLLSLADRPRSAQFPHSGGIVQRKSKERKKGFAKQMKDVKEIKVRRFKLQKQSFSSTLKQFLKHAFRDC